MDSKITKHVNDIIQKHANGLFRNATLDFYGIKTAPIQELVSPELPKVEVHGGGTDIVFLLTDNTYLHLAFETSHEKSDMPKNASYDLRLYERDGRNIRTVIICTAETTEKPEGLQIGSLTYAPDVILMHGYDGNAVFVGLEAKIKAGKELSDLDMMNLVLLPLMRHTFPRQTLAIKSIELAQTIPDATKRNTCIAAAFAFASRYLEAGESEKLWEVLKMTDLFASYVVNTVENAVTNSKKEIATSMLKSSLPISSVVLHTGLDEPTVRRLQSELGFE